MLPIEKRCSLGFIANLLAMTMHLKRNEYENELETSHIPTSNRELRTPQLT
jgi:hypothetical protein